MRPGGFDNLKVKQLLPPVAAAGRAYSHWTLLANPFEDRISGKTGIFDLSIVLDSDAWIHPFLSVLVSGRSPEAPLWTLNGADIIRDLNAAIVGLGLEHLEISRYSLRHGGASHDLLSGARSRAEVQARGGWMTEASVRRYGKAGRALAECARSTQRS